MRTATLLFLGLALGLAFATAYGEARSLWVAQHYSGTSYFTDCVPGSPHNDDIGWVCEYPVAGGYGDGRYGPRDVVTREQMATFIVRQGHLDWTMATLATDRYLFGGYYTGYQAYQEGRISYEDYQVFEGCWGWMQACTAAHGPTGAAASDSNTAGLGAALRGVREMEPQSR